jgi:hypothetical protein
MIEYTVKVNSEGTKYWCLNGKLHREDGPAIEYINGTKQWCLNGKLHREDGPAIEYSYGTKSWWLEGKRVTEEEFNMRMKAKASCNGKMVTVDGKQYKLTEVE